MRPDELRRYGRQILLTELGLEGQRRLRAARVLCVGVGGLGCPAAQYLTAAGVGTLGLVDSDAVEESNLQRQILYESADVGRSKLQAAKRRLEALNADVAIELFERRLTAGNALDLVRGFDVVVDGTDNFAARYAVNDACVRAGRPNVHGAALGFEGRVAVFAPGGPCLRCLYPRPSGAAASCAQAGIVGAVTGVVGAMQALETIKLLAGSGRPLSGRLLVFDGLAAVWRALELRRDPACPACAGLSRPGGPPAGTAPCSSSAPRPLETRP